jgi:hypothetical protein
VFTERREGITNYHYLFDSAGITAGEQGSVLLSLDPEKWGFAEVIMLEENIYLAQGSTNYEDLSFAKGTNLLVFFNSYNNQWLADPFEQSIISEDDYLIVTSKINLAKKYSSTEGEFTPIAMITHNPDGKLVIHPAVADRFWDGAKYRNKNVKLYLKVDENLRSTEEEFSVLQLMQSAPRITEIPLTESPVLNIESLTTLSVEVTKILTGREILPKSKIMDPEVVPEKLIKGYRVTLHLPTTALKRILDITKLQEELTQVGKQYGFGTRLFFVPDSEMTDMIPNEIAGTFYLRSYASNSIESFSDRRLTIDTQIRLDPYRQLRKWLPRNTSDRQVQQDRRIWKIELTSSSFDELIWCLSGIMRSHGRTFIKKIEPEQKQD